MSAQLPVADGSKRRKRWLLIGLAGVIGVIIATVVVVGGLKMGAHPVAAVPATTSPTPSANQVTVTPTPASPTPSIRPASPSPKKASPAPIAAPRSPSPQPPSPRPTPKRTPSPRPSPKPSPTPPPQCPTNHIVYQASGTISGGGQTKTSIFTIPYACASFQLQWAYTTNNGVAITFYVYNNQGGLVAQALSNKSPGDSGTLDVANGVSEYYILVKTVGANIVNWNFAIVD